jgi:taurine dioxygenase
MAIEIIPTGAALGAEVRGFDASRPVTDPDRAAIRGAWLEHLVLLFRDQQLDNDDQFGLAAIFGDLGLPAHGLLGLGRRDNQPEEMPDAVSVISNIVEDGKPIGNLGSVEAKWHTDSSFVDRPPSASVLYGVEVPPEGGNTSFLNMYAALETLPAALREQIEGRQTNHSCVHSSSGERRAEFDEVTEVSEAPGAKHPIIRTHPETGRQCLFLGRRLNSYILGLPVPESEALLDALWAHTLQPRFVWEHRWRVGDVLVWDNRSTMHHRQAFDPGTRRRLHKIQVMGEAPA